MQKIFIALSLNKMTKLIKWNVKKLHYFEYRLAFENPNSLCITYVIRDLG